MAPSVEEIADVCRAHLRESIAVTGQLMRAENTAAEALLARMNDVLGACVDTNFGPATRDHLLRLHETIGRAQPALIDTCENLALFYLSRSFAVVLAEAVRQKEELLAALAKAECKGVEEYGSEKEEEYGSDEKKDKEEYGIDESSTVVVTEEQQSEHGRCVSPSSLSSSSADGDWSRLPVDLADFSEHERRGLLTIHGISPHLGKAQLEPFLDMWGRVAELRLYPKWEGWQTGLAIVRYEKMEEAHEALAKMDLKYFFGTRLHVRCFSPRATRESTASDADLHATAADAPYPPPTPPPPVAPTPTDTDTVADGWSSSDSDFGVD